MHAPPLAFDNDDEEAAAHATDWLMRNVQQAATREAQEAAVATWKLYVEHERVKRQESPDV